MADGIPNLPALADAKLPATYQAAQKALSECSRVDECKEWSDKAQALASYARQAKDSTLHNLALRIQARAQRRAGELLKQIPSAQGMRTDQLQEGAHLKLTREAVAREAGLSDHQRRTAQRVASIPAPEFEAAVESGKPPSITELAIRGTVSKPQADPQPTEQARRAQTTLREFAAFCAANDPAAVAHGSIALDIDLLRSYVETIDGWLDRYVTSLGD